MKSLKGRFAMLLVPFSSMSLMAEMRVFLGEPRQSYWLNESVPIGVSTTIDLKGRLSLNAKRKDGVTVRLLTEKTELKAGETLLRELLPYALREGEYELTAEMNGQKAVLRTLNLVSPIRRTNFLFSFAGGADKNAELGATWTNLDLYNYAKLAGKGEFAPDPLTPSGYERGIDRAIARGLRGFVWQGLWTGYVLHQPFFQSSSYNDPGLRRLAMQCAELGAQRARRFLSVIASLSGMDEPGLGYGIVREGKFRGETMTSFPDAFQRAEYEKLTGISLPLDPRDLPDEEWLRWFRWRAGILLRFFSEAKRHIKRVCDQIPWGQDIYASFAICDGTHPFNQRMNDVPTTHSFMFWRGVAEQSWNFAVERTARRDERFHFASNTNYFSFNNPPDAISLADIVTNYAIMDGVEMLWHLSFGDYRKLKPSYDRLARFGDFILATLPARHPVAVLYSFREPAMRLKEAGEIGTSEMYRVCLRYHITCGALFHSIRRAGYTADIVHEEELPEGGLKGRKVLSLVGIKHPLDRKVTEAIVSFANSGGKLLADKTTTWLPSGISVERAAIDPSTFAARLFDAQEKSRSLSAEDKYEEASRLTRQLTSDRWRDEYAPEIKRILTQALGAPELLRSLSSIITGKWLSGRGKYHLLLNDSQKDLTNPTLEREIQEKVRKIFPASDWAEAVRITFNKLKKNEAVYLIEGRDWSRVRALKVRRGDSVSLDFEPTEMKIFCVLPSEIRGVVLKVRLKRVRACGMLRVETYLRGRRGRIKAPFPLRVKVIDPAGAGRDYFRSTDWSGIYREDFPIPTDYSGGRWTVLVSTPLDSTPTTQTIAVPEVEFSPLRTVPDVYVFDERAIRALLRSKERVVVVLGDNSGREEKGIARALAFDLKSKGVKIDTRNETEVRRRGLYPKVFPAIEKVDDVWKDLALQERRDRRKEWEVLRNWAGAFGYPPGPPDAFGVDDHLILVGTDRSSTLIQALQRASILPRVSNEYYPGRGRGFVMYAWSPFALGKDVILVIGSDPDGVRKSAEKLVELAR